MVDYCSGSAAARAAFALAVAVRAVSVGRVGDIEDDATRAARLHEAAGELEALEGVATVDVEGADAPCGRVLYLHEKAYRTMAR